MQKRLKIVALMLLITLLTTMAAYAVIKYTEIIPTTGIIKGYEIQLWQTDTNTRVTAIPWGDLETGTSKTTDEAFGFEKKLKIKNTGDYPCWIAWQLDPETPLPEGCTLIAQYYYVGGAQWRPLPENMFSDSFTWKQWTTYTDSVMWTLTIDADVPRGEITFNILLLAADTELG